MRTTCSAPSSVMSCASSAVSCVIVKTKTRSKNSSSVETRTASSCCAAALTVRTLPCAGAIVCGLAGRDGGRHVGLDLRRREGAVVQPHLVDQPREPLVAPAPVAADPQHAG